MQRASKARAPASSDEWGRAGCGAQPLRGRCIGSRGVVRAPRAWSSTSAVDNRGERGVDARCRAWGGHIEVSRTAPSSGRPGLARCNREMMLVGWLSRYNIVYQFCAA